MSQEYFKFPSTPHLANLPGLDVRDDKVFTAVEREAFLQDEVWIEEKLDGANLGISFDREGRVFVQNRGTYIDLPATGQWKKLETWLDLRINVLFDVLSDRYILFGEWCYAQHSIFYNRLPDWFLAFDIFDRVEMRFMSASRRDVLIEKLQLAKVPLLARGKFSFECVKKFLSTSRFGDTDAEGLYLRVDKVDWLLSRAKLVRTDFIQSQEHHWSKSVLKTNKLAFGHRVE